MCHSSLLYIGGHLEVSVTYHRLPSWLVSLQVVNHHLLKDLTELGLWDETMKHKLIAHNGSVQVRHIPAGILFV